MKGHRRPLVAGNWKMHFGGPSSCTLAADIARGADSEGGVDVLIAPPFTALAAVAMELDGSRLMLAAQNLHDRPKGAFTGEVSGPMLLECGVKWVIVGHSERRHLMGETDEFAARKVAAALEFNLLPILCVGETLAEREAGETMEVIFRQLDAAFGPLLSAGGAAALAYEPVWAIGTGHNATPDQAQQVHRALRARLNDRSSVLAERTRILYGGSVKPDNAESLLRSPDVDGALVGGASLDASQFIEIVRAASRS
jgi:triosephosphate isomerase